MMAIRANDFPALRGTGVTQAHVDYCRANGHAVHLIDGTDTNVCPRCGEISTIEKEESTVYKIEFDQISSGQVYRMHGEYTRRADAQEAADELNAVPAAEVPNVVPGSVRVVEVSE